MSNKTKIRPVTKQADEFIKLRKGLIDIIKDKGKPISRYAKVTNISHTTIYRRINEESLTAEDLIKIMRYLAFFK